MSLPLKPTRRAVTTMLAGAAASALAQTRATALCLCGDESHNSDYIRTALTSTLTDDAGLSIDFTDQEKLLTAANLNNYKILIMFRDGLRFPHGYYQAIYWTGKKDDVVSEPPLRKQIGGGQVGWMTPEQGKAIKAWVQGGGSLWAFHNNSQASILNQDYRDVEGAIYTGHPPIRPFKVKIINRDHPIMKASTTSSSPTSSTTSPTTRTPSSCWPAA